MKKVLIALDYDSTAQKVAESGMALAKKLGAQVTLLHITTNSSYYSSTGHIPVKGFASYMDAVPLVLESELDMKTAAQLFLDNSKKHLKDVNIHTMVKEGELSETILKVAADIKADIIVLGSHSRRWLENIIMGGVTEKVLKLTTIPLFIVPTKKK